jgi:error-prone DNA polymerase
LGVVRRAFDAVGRATGERPEMYRLPPDDPATFACVAAGDTVGMFQVESRAQISSLVHTRPEKLYDLVVQVALIRPGPIVAKFVHPYTRRRRGLERVEYPPGMEALLAPILGRTQGIPIFQEQAMALAMRVAGYTAAEADELRRTMGHQRKAARLAAAVERCARAWRRAASTRRWPRGSPTTCGCSPTTASPRATRGASRSSPTPRRGSRRTTRRRSTARCSTRSRWASTRWPRSCTTRGGAASRCGRRAWRSARRRARSRSATTRPTRRRCAWGGGRCAARRRRARAAHGGARPRPLPLGGRRGAPRRARRDEAAALARAHAFAVWVPDRRRAVWEALRVAGDVLPLARAGAYAPPATRGAARGDGYAPPPRTRTSRCSPTTTPWGSRWPGTRWGATARGAARVGALSSADLARCRGGERVVTAGLVITRQRPTTAKGTTFLLLEDEHGTGNVIVPPKIDARDREATRHGAFVLVLGRAERDGPLVNVIARRVEAFGPEVLRGASLPGPGTGRWRRSAPSAARAPLA